MKFHEGDKIHSIEELRESWAEEPDRWYTGVPHGIESKKSMFNIVGWNAKTYIYETHGDSVLNGVPVEAISGHKFPLTIIPDPRVKQETPKVEVKPGQVWEWKSNPGHYMYITEWGPITLGWKHSKDGNKYIGQSMPEGFGNILTDRRVVTLSPSEEIVDRAELARLRAIEARLRDMVEAHN